MALTTIGSFLEGWYAPGRGPRYQQLHRHIADAILGGSLEPGQQLPPERDMAEMADISRVTVRKAVAQLVRDGLIEQRQGAGSFVRNKPAKFVQSLSSLVSFTENMEARGVTSTSVVLHHAVSAPSPDEMLTLGLSGGDRVARIRRLRSADDTPMALEVSSLPADVLPDPSLVGPSLYAVLRTRGLAPTRAVQRVTAENIAGETAELLHLPEGAAALKIVRTGFLSTGRPIELTSGYYRSDIYDFVAELRPDGSNP